MKPAPKPGVLPPPKLKLGAGAAEAGAAALLPARLKLKVGWVVGWEAAGAELAAAPKGKAELPKVEAAADDAPPKPD